MCSATIYHANTLCGCTIDEAQGHRLSRAPTLLQMHWRTLGQAMATQKHTEKGRDECLQGSKRPAKNGIAVSWCKPRPVVSLAQRTTHNALACACAFSIVLVNAPGIKWCCSLPQDAKGGALVLCPLSVSLSATTPAPTVTGDAGPCNEHKEEVRPMSNETRVFATIFLVSWFFFFFLVMDQLEQF